MNKQHIIAHILGTRPVAYNPDLAKALGSAKAGIFISQLLYWMDKTKSEWVYKTIDEIYEETALTRKEQETAIKHCKKLGILEVELRGIPARRYFRLNVEKIIELLQTRLTKMDKQVCTEVTNKFAQNGQASLHKSYKQVCPKVTNKFAQNGQTNSENTTEITTKITSENTSETTTESIEYTAQSCKSISEPTAAANDDPPLVVIPLNGKTKEFPITQQMIDDWQKDFPSVDVLSELRKMHAWSEANPNKRKTIKGVKRFIVNWLSREQDRIKSSSVGGGSAAVNSGYSRHPQNLRLVNNMDAVRGFLENLERKKQGKEAAW